MSRVDPTAIVARMPLRTRTPLAWGAAVLAEPIALLADHAHLEMKAANNAMDLMTRWPGDWIPGWVEAMTSVTREEAAHLSQVSRLLLSRGGRLPRGHSNPYARDLRLLVRRDGEGMVLDRLFVSALLELRSCERFSVLMQTSQHDPDLHSLYKSLFSSEHGHYRSFLRLAMKAASQPAAAEARWEHMLDREAEIINQQQPGPRIHSAPQA
jgi:tRNA 2-(methylsulfanyl)-N6-isopentenyladenosine37 hydroxylase